MPDHNQETSKCNNQEKCAWALAVIGCGTIMGTTLAACIAGWKIGIGPVAGAYGAGITTTFFGTTGLCFSGSTKSSAQPSEATSLLEPEDNGVDSQAHPAPKEMH